MVKKLIFTKINQTSNSMDLEVSKLQTIDQLKARLEQFHNNLYKIATSIYPCTKKEIYPTLLTKGYLTKIINSVKETQKSEIQFNKLIYLGSRDGLNIQSFRSKVNDRKNLLMIFKSKSNYIFGGYFPCQWQQNLNNYVQDNTNSSFLFSQTHDEIYPIVDTQKAIYCSLNQGPVFGGYDIQIDIQIALDFYEGHSKLGHSYQQGSKYQGQYETKLFGQSTPNTSIKEI